MYQKSANTPVVKLARVVNKLDVTTCPLNNRLLSPDSDMPFLIKKELKFKTFGSISSANEIVKSVSNVFETNSLIQVTWLLLATIVGYPGYC